LKHHALFWPYLALLSVCFFWGTTYLTIRMALETFPPLILVAVRMTTAGLLLLSFARLRGIYIPRGAELRDAAITGLFTLGAANILLVVAETMVPSGLAGLLQTIVPFWMVGFEALVPGGARLHMPTLGGMVLGLGGTALLMVPGLSGGQHGMLLGFLLLNLGMAAWAFGSIYQRRHQGRAHPVISGAIHQIAAGGIAALLALVIPQGPLHWSARGVGGLVYLIFFGSIVGYSSYAYALGRLPVAILSIYPYVNAVVAVVLGWLVYREAFGWRETVATGIIFTGVWVVKRYASARL
jgi:drug/metabolite transporter (DMT)-like permease